LCSDRFSERVFEDVSEVSYWNIFGSLSEVISEFNSEVLFRSFGQMCSEKCFEILLKRFRTFFRTLANFWQNRQRNVFGNVFEHFRYFSKHSVNNETIRNIFRKHCETFPKSFRNISQILTKVTTNSVRKGFRNAFGNL
jgi:uncharacterized protein with von Willebrand factor type A (vWA) domain